MKVSDGPSMMEEDEEVARLKSQVKEENFRPIFTFLLLPFCDSLNFLKQKFVSGGGGDL